MTTTRSTTTSGRTITAGTISPRRSVPQKIARPEYVGRSEAREGHESYVKDAETIERIRVAESFYLQLAAETGIVIVA